MIPFSPTTLYELRKYYDNKEKEEAQEKYPVLCTTCVKYPTLCPILEKTCGKASACEYYIKENEK